MLTTRPRSIALGADGVCLGTADMVALECLRCHHCESGRGCARGIATTDEELTNLMDVEWGTQRIINMYLAWCEQLKQILKRLGMKSIKELTGRTDVLVHIDYMKKEEDAGRDRLIVTSYRLQYRTVTGRLHAEPLQVAGEASTKLTAKDKG